MKDLEGAQGDSQLKFSSRYRRINARCRKIREDIESYSGSREIQKI
jgi:hypothetical protein